MLRVARGSIARAASRARSSSTTSSHRLRPSAAVPVARPVYRTLAEGSVVTLIPPLYLTLAGPRAAALDAKVARLGHEEAAAQAGGMDSPGSLKAAADLAAAKWYANSRAVGAAMDAGRDVDKAQAAFELAKAELKLAEDELWLAEDEFELAHAKSLPTWDPMSAAAAELQAAVNRLTPPNERPAK